MVNFDIRPFLFLILPNVVQLIKEFQYICKLTIMSIFYYSRGYNTLTIGAEHTAQICEVAYDVELP